MKKSLNKFSVVILISILSIYSAFGQDKTKYDIQKLIKLNNESDVQEIVLPVKDSLNSVTIVVYSDILAGDVTIEIYDPTGEKNGYFSIGCQSNTIITDNKKYLGKTVYRTNPDKASGNLSRTIKKPIGGDWKVKIIPKNAIGTVNIDFALKDLGHTYIISKKLSK